MRWWLCLRMLTLNVTNTTRPRDVPHSTPGHTDWEELGWDDRPDMYLLLVKSPSTATNTPYCVGRRNPAPRQIIGLPLLEETAPIDGNISAELLFLEKASLWKSRGPTSRVGVESRPSRSSKQARLPIRSTSLYQNVLSNYAYSKSLFSYIDLYRTL